MNSRAANRRDNGGPPLNDGETVDVHLGQKYLDLFKPSRHKAYYGGRGGAKSHAFATALVILASRHSLRIVCARQFQNSIRDSVKELLENKIKAMGLEDQFKILEREIEHHKTGSRFTFIGLDRNPDSAKSLEGADICWVEEARTISQRSLEILIPTIRKPGSEIWWSWNPEFREDPVDEYFRGGLLPPDTIIHYVGIEDNPWFFHTALPDEMFHMKQGNPKRYQHIWLGGYDDDYEGRIFQNVSIGRVDIPDHVAPRYGMDFGFGSHPSAVVRVYLIEDTKTIYIAGEAFGRLPLRDLPDMIHGVTLHEDDYVKADSADPGTIDHLQSEGINMAGAVKGPGSIRTGINFIQGYHVVIDPDCENMREEARLYSWQQDRITKKRLSVPVDAHNHGWDAVRYALEDLAMGYDAKEESEDGGVFKLR